jgi:hypothetical protein
MKFWVWGSGIFGSNTPSYENLKFRKSLKTSGYKGFSPFYSFRKICKILTKLNIVHGDFMTKIIIVLFSTPVENQSFSVLKVRVLSKKD